MFLEGICIKLKNINKMIIIWIKITIYALFFMIDVIFL